MATIVHHSGKNIPKIGVPFRFAVPLGYNSGGNFNVAAQLFDGMPAQKKTIKKSRLALREVEIISDFRRNKLWHRGHKEKAVYPKARRRQVGLEFFCDLPGTPSTRLSSQNWMGQRGKWLRVTFDRRRMLRSMKGLHNSGPRSLAGRTVGRFLRFGVLRGLRSVEVDPEQFRRTLSEKHGLWVPGFNRMKDVPIERLDAIAAKLIRDAERLALAEGAGLGLGGMVTFLPDASFLTIITLRLIQRLTLLYGFEASNRDVRLEMWMAAASAAGVDYGKDLAEKQLLERLGPRIAARFAARVGAEAAEKWVGRLIPLASSAISGGLNFAFVRSWGRRAQRHLRERHLQTRIHTQSPIQHAAKIAPVVA